MVTAATSVVTTSSTRLVGRWCTLLLGWELFTMSERRYSGSSSDIVMTSSGMLASHWWICGDFFRMLCCLSHLLSLSYTHTHTHMHTRTHTHIHSLALHPEKKLVATAQIGKDPFICVWDSTTLETVSILQGGHERGISTLGFNRDGNVSYQGRLYCSCKHPPFQPSLV